MKDRTKHLAYKRKATPVQYRPINKPATAKQLASLPNQEHKKKHSKDRPVSGLIEKDSPKISREKLQDDLKSCNISASYIPSQGYKRKHVVKAKAKAMPKMHYSTLAKKLPSKRK